MAAVSAPCPPPTSTTLAYSLKSYALTTAAVAPDGSVPLDPKLWKKLDLTVPEGPRDPHPELLAAARVAASTSC